MIIGQWLLATLLASLAAGEPPRSLLPRHASLTPDDASWVHDLDEASSRLDATTKKTLPTDLPARFNVTAGPPQRTGVNQRTGYCWYELAGEWSRLEGDQCSQRDAKGRLQP